MSITIAKRFKKYLETRCDVRYYLEDLLIMVDIHSVHHLTLNITRRLANPLKC